MAGPRKRVSARVVCKALSTHRSLLERRLLHVGKGEGGGIDGKPKISQSRVMDRGVHSWSRSKGR
jgi:hypothetical protein